MKTTQRKPTVGKWESDIDIMDDGEFLCQVLDKDGLQIAKVNGYVGNGDGRESEANTNFIVTMQNACYEINPEHPELVAENIVEMFNYLQAVSVLRVIEEQLPEFYKKINAFLNAIEGGK